MLRRVGDVVLDEYLHPDFHRCMKDAVHRGTQDHEVSDTHWHEEIDVIDRSSDHVVAGMTVARHGSGKFDPMHQAATEKCSQWVGIVGQNDFSHLRLRISDGAWDEV